MDKNDLFQMFERLDELGVYQFKSHISALQYMLAYRLVEHYAKKPASILDWGTGSGHFSLFLLEQGFNVTAFTIQNDCQLSRYLSDSFPDRYRLIIESQAVDRLPFEGNSFDVVTSIGVLEHVRETGGDEIISLMEIRRVLKSNGVFICCHLPNKYSWIEAINRHIKTKYSHQYKYSRGDIETIVRKSGLLMVETSRYGLFPRLMFRRFPDYTALTLLFHATDRFFSSLFPFVCQNHYIVAQKGCLVNNCK